MLSEELLDFADRTNQSSKRLEMRINDNIESYTVILTRAMESDGELRPGAPGAAAKRNYEKVCSVHATNKLSDTCLIDSSGAVSGQSLEARRR